MVEYTYAYDSQIYDKVIDMVYEFINRTNEKTMLDLFNEHIMSKYNGSAELNLYSDMDALKMTFDE